MTFTRYELKENNSAKIALHSINYNKIMSHYGNNKELIISELTKEVSELLTYQPDCIILCCNSLHKYLDDIIKNLNIQLPAFHVINLLIKEIIEKSYESPLLLSSVFSITDGFVQKSYDNM